MRDITADVLAHEKKIEEYQELIREERDAIERLKILHNEEFMAKQMSLEIE